MSKRLLDALEYPQANSLNLNGADVKFFLAILNNQTCF